METNKLDIIVLAGQSNACGYGIGDTQDPYEQDERILWMCDDQNINFVTDEDNGYDYLKVKYPSDFFVRVAKEAENKNGKLGNLALYFARQYVWDGRLQEGRKLLIVNAAVGGTGFAKHHWGVDEVLYKRMTDMIDKALSFEGENRIVAFLWHQGEHDAFENAELSPKTRKAFYYDKFNAFVCSLRQRYARFDFPVLCGGFTDEWTKQNAESCKAVTDALKTVCAKDGNAGLVSSRGLLSNNEQTGNGDVLHFSRDSLRKLGIRYYNKYAKLICHE